MYIRALLICFLLISCAQKKVYKRPNYIKFKTENDSVFVIVNNHVISTSFLKIENLNNNKTQFIDFTKPDTLTVLKFHKSEIDTITLDKEYKFLLQYGNSTPKAYDTLYNYGLPFLKGKRYKVLQGNNGSFSHRKPTSRYAIDFKMNVGQTVCAIRDGLVIQTKSDSDEGGNSEKYMNKANKILVFHKDGTYVQYAHFKKDGVLVQKGDSIKKGQPIGYSGNTGYSTQPHLHFVLYKSSKDGLISIPFILDSVKSSRYKTNKVVFHD
ncbi:M23 family metallopeptidase [Polaribacter aestuariivivens]|uniref:M23 family metallopeptidase n=1 Tax=Polaribacter aestuariivivens TaxID=2304626 RepID=UPI003F495C09